MGIGLAHVDFTPLFYGLVMFLGLLSMWHKLTHMRLLAFTVEVAVFTLVFTLHGGTMAGGFAAMIAALFAGVIFPMMLRRKS